MGNVVRARVRVGPTLLVALLAAATSLSACSSSSHSSSAPSTSSSQPSSSTPAGSTPTTGAAAIVANTGVKVTGGFDSKPTVTFPASQPPKQLVEQTLLDGSGTPVVAGDTVITNYVGEIWPT
jgi:peptidylprolyl isomerase